MKMNNQQLGSLFTDLRDKVENLIVDRANSALIPTQPVAKPATMPATIAGVSVTTLGILGVLGLFVYKKFLK
jgi:hypothetical protein